MALTTPTVVQSAFVSVPASPGSSVEYPIGYNVLTLPNPVTIGNQLLIVTAGGGDGSSNPPYLGNLDLPSGWSNICQGAGGDDSVAGAILQRTAQTTIPPSITVPYSGYSSQAALLLEVANCSEFLPFSGNLSASGDNITVGPFGSAQSVASLYIAMAYTQSPGLNATNPLPAGASVLATLNGVDIAYSAPWTSFVIGVASSSEISISYTQSAQISGQSSYVCVQGLAANVPVPPPTPAENIVASPGSQDVVYVVVERTTVRGGLPYRYYTVEVMASRLLGGNFAQAVPSNVEYSWAVDAGVQIAPAAPDADLWITVLSEGAITALDIVLAGENYETEIVGNIIDAAGQGSGAEISFTVTSGSITGYTIVSAGTGYIQPVVQIQSLNGYGAVITATASSTCSLISNSAIFASGNVGEVVRAAGGKVLVTSYVDDQELGGTILEPFTAFVPNTNQPGSCLSTQWTIGPQISQLPYLDHLEGMTVTGLADGSVIPPVEVVNGAIALPNAASIVTVGLGFTAQLKTLRLDLGNQGGGTIQSKRKKVSAVTLRVQDTQGLMVGTEWSRMTPIKAAGFAPSNAPLPFSQGGGIQAVSINGLYGQEPVSYLDQRNLPPSSWDVDGQICVQQSYPLPMSILAIIPEITVGDT